MYHSCKCKTIHLSLKRTNTLHGYRPEHVESRQSRGDHHARHLRVPVDLLDLRLTLVQEQQLRGKVPDRLHPGAHVAWLHRQIPLADDVVCARGGEHAGVHGVPLHRGDGSAVLLEVGHGTPGLQEQESSEVWQLFIQFQLSGVQLWKHTRSNPWTEQLLSCFRPAWRTKGLGVHQKGDLCSCFYWCTQRCLKGLNMLFIRCK